MENKNNGKLTVALLAGVALGGWISSLFSSKKLLKDSVEPNNGLKKRIANKQEYNGKHIHPTLVKAMHKARDQVQVIKRQWFWGSVLC